MMYISCCFSLHANNSIYIDSYYSEGKMHSMYHKYKLLVFFILLNCSFPVLGFTVDLHTNSTNDSTSRIELMRISDENYKEGVKLWESGNLDRAISVMQKSISANQSLQNENALRILYNNIGMIYTDKDDFESALLYFRKSLSILEKRNDPKEIAAELINISVSLQNLKRYYEAIELANKSIELSKLVNDLQSVKRGYGILAESYEKVGEAEKSIEYFGLYATLDRHFQQQKLESAQFEAQKQIAEANSKTQEAHKKTDIATATLNHTAQKLENTQKLTKLQEAKLQMQSLEIRQRDIIIKHKNLLNKVYVGSICFALLLLTLILWSYWQKKKSSEMLAAQNKEIMRQQEIIEKKNLNITQSISYAQRIQEAMLPSKVLFQEKLPDSFIYFKPRDIVSGDFYWLATDRIKSAVVQNEELGDEDDIFIAAADCTGHGVPGAFMSMIGYNLLNEIVARRIYSPAKILEALNNGVKNALKQETTRNSDGMDITICRIRKKVGVVEFSAAMNPMYYCQNGEIHEIEGGLFSVGGDELELGMVSYPSETVKIISPTTFYIFSDGFYDQFGGSDGHKFMSKRFKDYLYSIHHLPMQEQFAALDHKFKEWMGNHEQVDDVLVIGFRL